MKEDGIAGLELAMDTLELPLRPLHPLGIGSALGGVALSGGQKRNSLVLKLTGSPTLLIPVPDGHMVQSAHLVRAGQNSQTAVFLSARVQRYKNAAHVRCQTAVLVPVSIVLMPNVPSANLKKRHFLKEFIQMNEMKNFASADFIISFEW